MKTKGFKINFFKVLTIFIILIVMLVVYNISLITETVNSFYSKNNSSSTSSVTYSEDTTYSEYIESEKNRLNNEFDRKVENAVEENKIANSSIYKNYKQQGFSDIGYELDRIEKTLGTSDTLYIDNANQLIALSYYVNVNSNSCVGETIILLRDVELPDIYYWEPIGTEIVPFKGTFDGNYNDVFMNYFDAINKKYNGLFGVNDGSIKNIAVDINGGYHGENQVLWVGLIAGENRGTVENCYYGNNDYNVYYKYQNFEQLGEKFGILVGHNTAEGRITVEKYNGYDNMNIRDANRMIGKNDGFYEIGDSYDNLDTDSYKKTGDTSTIDSNPFEIKNIKVLKQNENLTPSVERSYCHDGILNMLNTRENYILEKGDRLYVEIDFNSDLYRYQNVKRNGTTYSKNIGTYDTYRSLNKDRLR